MENGISNGFAGSARPTHRQFKVAMTVLAVAVLYIPGASAQSGPYPHTWVASNGSDSAPCSREKPCATFQGALSRTAPGGEVDAVDSADYGPVNITRPVTIDGGDAGAFIGSGTAQNACGGAAAVCVATGGYLLAVGETVSVTLRRLSINVPVQPGGDGIRITSPNYVTFVNLEKIAVAAPGPHGCVTVGGVVQMKVTDADLRDCNIGISLGAATNGSLFSTSSTLLDNVRIKGAGTLSAIICSLCGTVNAHNITLSGWATAVYATGSNATIAIDSSFITTNQQAISAAFGGTVLLGNTSVMNNNLGLVEQNATILSFGNNRIANNATNGSPTKIVAMQ